MVNAEKRGKRSARRGKTRASSKEDMRIERRGNVLIITKSRVYVPPPPRKTRYKSLWELLFS